MQLLHHFLHRSSFFCITREVFVVGATLLFPNVILVKYQVMDKQYPTKCIDSDNSNGSVAVMTRLCTNKKVNVWYPSSSSFSLRSQSSVQFLCQQSAYNCESKKQKQSSKQGVLLGFYTISYNCCICCCLSVSAMNKTNF